MSLRGRARLPSAAAAGLWAALAGCGRGGEADLSRARADHQALQKAFAKVVAEDPVVSEAMAAGGHVALGLRPALVEDLLGQVSARYLDRVVLDLPLEQRVRDTGTLRVKTFFGRVTAGEWAVDVTVHRVRGRLQARPPTVTAAPDNALRLEVPVDLQEGQGTATVHFAWDGRSVASVVCRDFEVTQRLRGRALAAEYALSADFKLSAGPERVHAEPDFRKRTFRVRVDLDEPSWGQVRAAIDEQDRLLRCGLGLDPDSLLPRLRGRLAEGFDVKLPRSLLRPVDFPAGVRQSATIQDHRVDLSVKTRELKVSPAAVWYSVDVRTRISEAEEAASGPPPPSPGPAAGPGLR